MDAFNIPVGVEIAITGLEELSAKMIRLSRFSPFQRSLKKIGTVT
jgi:hypothetical protein